MAARKTQWLREQEKEGMRKVACSIFNFYLSFAGYVLFLSDLEIVLCTSDGEENDEIEIARI